MALLSTPTSEANDRKSTWGSLGSQSYDSPGDIQTGVPLEQKLDYQKKVGVVSAFTKGLPKEEGYIPTIPESIASGVTDFVRSGTEVGMELFSEDYKEARKSIEKVRQYNPDMADQIEASTIGKKLSNAELAVKGGAALAEGALTFMPFFKVGRAALAAGEAEALIRAGKVGRTIISNPVLNKIYSGGINGALYGGLYGLHEYDADWSAAAKGAAMGGTFGAGLMGLGSSLAFAGKYGGEKVLQGFKFASDKIKETGIGSKMIESIPAKWYSGVFSVESTMKKYWGDIGENFINMYKQASREATQDLGSLQLKLIDHGLMEPPSGLGKAFKGVKFIGNDVEKMSYYNQVLRGRGAFSDKATRTAAINADENLQLLDGLRKTYGARSQQEGLVESLLDLDTYLPKHTPIVELSAKTRSALGKATTQAEREAAYASNDPMVKEMIDNSVQVEKAFKTPEEAYAAYYDYVDLVSEGAHTPIGDNKFLQKMVANGEAKTIEEAKGAILADLKYRKKSLTPLAASLDFKRKVNLPWYDPNPSRVMPQYAFDASMRIEMAKKFGANDEVLHEMLGKIKADLSRGLKADQAAKEFEDFVRQVTGQVMRSPGEEKTSAFIRALQVPKLAFAQIVNLGQSLNTLLASDFGVTMYGLTGAFKNQNTRNAIERGVLLNNFIREVFNYNSGGSKVAENIMKYSGFTFTEMFNRVVGSTAADMWAQKNLKTILSKYGVEEVSEAEQKNITKMLSDKAFMEKESLMGGLKVQEELYDSFRKMFPEEDFTASAGNLGAAKSRLKTLETSIADKTEKLQKARAILEKELLSETEPLTAKETADLEATIESLRGEIRSAEGISIGKEEGIAVKEYTEAERQAALDGIVSIKRARLEDVIARLESKFDEVRAMGDMPRDVVTMKGEAGQSEEKLIDYATRVSQEIKNIDSAIIGLQNELADKTRILEGAIDSYKISSQRAMEKFPEGSKYDEYISSRKKNVSSILEKIKKEDTREYWALQELNIPVEDVIARGFMTPEEKALAAQSFVEKTQFMGRPLDLPYFASTPTGKILFQFKTFAYQQARFVAKEMKDAFARKDYSRVFRNLFILGTVFPMTGEVLADVRSLITQEKRPTKALDRYLSDVYSAGSYGLFADFMTSAESGRTAEFFMGTTGGDAIRYIESLAKAPGQIVSGKGDKALENFTKNILKQTGVGRIGVNIYFPSQSVKGKSTLQSLIDWAGD